MVPLDIQVVRGPRCAHAALGVAARSARRRGQVLDDDLVRMALGATSDNVLTLVLRQGLVLTTCGCAIGIMLAAMMAQVSAPFLFGVSPLDPRTFIATSLLFTVVGSAACYGPARRAANIDPVIALRQD